MGDYITLVFTTVMDELSRGLVDEDEDAAAAPTDRTYWERQASKATVALADDLLEMVRQFDPTIELKYNKFYIGLSRDGQPFNFVSFRPKKSAMNFEIKIPQTGEIDNMIENSEFETLEYNKRWGLYRIRLSKDEIRKKSETLQALIKLAYERRSSV